MGMGATAPGGATPNTGSAQPSNVNTPAPGGKGGAAQAQPQPQVQQPAPGGKGGMQADPRVMSSISPQQGGFQPNYGMYNNQPQKPMMQQQDFANMNPQIAEQMRQQQMQQQQAAMGGKGGMPTSQAQAYAMQQLKDAQAGQLPQYAQQAYAQQLQGTPSSPQELQQLSTVLRGLPQNAGQIPTSQAQAYAMQQQNLMQRQQPQQNPMMDALTLHTPEYYQNQPQVQKTFGGPLPQQGGPTLQQLGQMPPQQMPPGMMAQLPQYAQQAMMQQQGQMPQQTPGQSPLQAVSQQLRGLPQNAGQMPQAPTQHRMGRRDERQEAQRAMQQFRPGMGRR